MNDNIFMHEVKNILSNIYLLAEIMEDSKVSNELSDDLLDNLALLKQSVDHLKNIEADYDQYKKVGASIINKTQVNLAGLITTIVSEYDGLAEHHSVSLSTNCRQIRITTDATKLKQVISNLVSNAIKYNPNGKVLIECRIINNKVNVIVKDTGIGLSAKEISTLGTAFYRCKKIETEGTGLGWAIIKSIVALMNWDIKVNSGSKSQFEYTTTVTLIL